MALREIRKLGDEVLTKKCRKIDVFDARLCELLDDMADTMKDKGVGIAACQVGVLKRVVVIDVGEGRIEMINPEIIACEGSIIDTEGCLSVPGKFGEVDRPAIVRAKALDRNGKEYTIEGEGLLARAICHEVEHLDGKLFLPRVIRFVDIDEERRKR